MKKTVLENLARNPHHYDDLIAYFMRCMKCGGCGFLPPDNDICMWESEGGPAYDIECECGGKKPRIAEDIVRRFFELPEPSRYIKISARRSGPYGFDVTIYTTLNPALQDAAMQRLDEFLFDDKNQWLMGIYPWATNYETGISYRHFSGEPKEAQTLLMKWFKKAEQIEIAGKKLGREFLSTEMS